MKHKIGPAVLLATLAGTTIGMPGLPVALAATSTPTTAVRLLSATNTETVTNLAQNATITTKVAVPDSHFAQSDSLYPGPVTSSSNWQGYNYQQARDITIHLPQVSTVTSLSLEFHQAVSSGIYYPKSVVFEVKQNGIWYSIGSAHSAIPLTDRRTTSQVYAIHTQPIVGQDFRIHFPVGVWVFARNLKVMGTPGSIANANTASLTPVSQMLTGSTGPLTANSPGAQGIQNMLLMSGMVSNTQADFLPMVGYYPLVASQPLQTGQATGQTGGSSQPPTGSSGSTTVPTSTTTPGQQSGQPTTGGQPASNGQTNTQPTLVPAATPTAHMFDTFLFTTNVNLPDNQQSWQTYVQDLFTAGNDLSALNSAVGQVNQQLGTPFYKAKVVLAMPYPAYGDGDFGVVNGQDLNFNGSPQDPNALAARTAAMRWFVDQLMTQWNSSNFSNLQLAGFYWENESISNTKPGEQQLVQNAAQIAGQYNLPLFWIPFYGAPHALDWKSAGFGAAWLQTNFPELGQNATTSRLTSAASLANQYGMGLEMELLTFNPTAVSLYEQSMQFYEQDGMSSLASHAFYDAAHFLTMAANSTDPTLRSLYDDTYQFMHG